MESGQKDEAVLGRIKKLVEEEHGLWSAKELDEPARARLVALKIELDQCWDLLRQRRARREFGEDPNQAKVRPANVVENYEQ